MASWTRLAKSDLPSQISIGQGQVAIYEATITNADGVVDMVSAGPRARSASLFQVATTTATDLPTTVEFEGAPYQATPAPRPWNTTAVGTNGVNRPLAPAGAPAAAASGFIDLRACPTRWLTATPTGAGTNYSIDIQLVIYFDD